MNKSKFNSFLKNKTVALVGPANYLSQFKFGKEINSKDIVVRINRGMELIKNNEIHLGNRTDVLYNCMVEHPDNGGVIDINELLKNKVKWICTVPHSSFDGSKIYPFVHPKANLIKLIKLNLKFNFHICDSKLLKNLNKNISCRANTGFAAIFDLLQHDLKELYITGFSFYLDSFLKGYKKECNRDEENFSLDCFKSVRHNQQEQWQYLKESKNNRKLNFDPVLSEILEMDTLDRNLFNPLIEKLKRKI